MTSDEFAQFCTEGEAALPRELPAVLATLTPPRSPIGDARPADARPLRRRRMTTGWRTICGWSKGLGILALKWVWFAATALCVGGIAVMAGVVDAPTAKRT